METILHHHPHRRVHRRAPVAAVLALAGLLAACQSQTEPKGPPSHSRSVQGISLDFYAATPAPQAAADCVDQALAPLIAQIQAGQLQPHRVKVYDDHPLVVEALKPPTLRLTHLRDGQPTHYWMTLATPAVRALIRQDPGGPAALQSPDPRDMLKLRDCLMQLPPPT